MVNVSNLTVLVEQSTMLVDLVLVPQTLRFVISFVGIITNILIITVVARSKELHTTFFFHVGCLAVADLVFCFAITLNSAPYLVAVTTKSGMVTNSLACFLSGGVGLMITAAVATQLANLSLAVDRMVAIIFPIRYSNLDDRYPRVVQLLCAIFNITLFTADCIMVALDSRTLEICSAISGARINSTEFYRAFTALIVVLTFACLIVTIFFLILRIINKQTSGLAQSGTTKLEVKMAKVVCVNSVIFLCSWVAGNLGIQIAQLVPSLNSNQQILPLGSYFGAMYAVNSAVTLFSYLALLKRFRMAFLSVVLCGRVIRFGAVVAPVAKGSTAPLNEDIKRRL